MAAADAAADSWSSAAESAYGLEVYSASAVVARNLINIYIVFSSMLGVSLIAAAASAKRRTNTQHYRRHRHWPLALIYFYYAKVFSAVDAESLLVWLLLWLRIGVGGTHTIRHQQQMEWKCRLL